MENYLPYDVIEEELNTLNKIHNVSVNTDVIKIKGFSGQEIITAIIVFTFAGIAKTVLSEIGKDLWSSSKSICKKIFKIELRLLIIK